MYYAGQLVTKKKIKFHLLSYKGVFVNSNRVIRFKLKEPLPDGRDQCYFEVWEVINLHTGANELQKFPIYVYSDSEESIYIEVDRKDPIDDSHEVTSLLDSYECWEKYLEEGISKRDGVNPQLDRVNLKHAKNLALLKELESSNITPELRVGVRLKIIQKETPNIQTHHMLKTWIKNNPELFTKIQNYAYFGNTASDSSLSED